METRSKVQRGKRKSEEEVTEVEIPKVKNLVISKLREKYSNRTKMSPRIALARRIQKQRIRMNQLEDTLSQMKATISAAKEIFKCETDTTAISTMDPTTLMVALIEKIELAHQSFETPESVEESTGPNPTGGKAQPPDMEIDPNCREYSVEEEVMSNPLIATKIFQHLEKEELLQMRKVNRIWNKNASLVLRENKYCIANFYFTDRDRKGAQFNKLMANSVANPFSGFALKVSNPANKADEVPVDVGPLRHLEIDLKHIPEPDLESTIRSLQETMASSAQCLEELSLLSLPDQIQRFYQMFPARNGLFNLENKFPNLKKLTISKRQSESQTNPKIFRDLLKASPNLQELDGDIVPQLTRSIIIAKKVDLVKTFRFVHNDISDIHLTMKFAAANPKFFKFRVESCLYRQMGHIGSAMKTIIRKLLDCNQDTLEFLDITELTLLKVFADGSARLKALKRLSIRYDVNCGRKSYSPLQRILFKNCFPALNLVILFLDNIYEDDVQGSFVPDFSEDGEIHQCRTVRKLKIVGKQTNSGLLHKMAQMFPKVIELHLAHTREYHDIFSALWSAWPKIKYIQADLKDIYVMKSLDSVFTGFPQHVCDEIVSTGKYHSFSAYERGQSIMNLTKLRRILLDLHRVTSTKQTKGRPLRFAMQPFLNEVTFRCTLDLMPKLRFQANLHKYEPKHYHFNQ